MEVNTKFGTLEATIPDNTKGIFISISGGMDSATLLYMLCHEIREKNLNIPIYCGICAYPYDKCSIFNGGLVIKHMKREFPDINIHVRTWVGAEMVGTMKAQLILGLYHEVLQEQKWSQWECRCWWGLTSNPDETFTFKEPDGWYVNIDTNRTPGNIDKKRKPLYGCGSCHPFRDISKKVLVAAQWKLGIFPCYATITNSCTDVKEYECRKCWWCQERAWAINNSIPGDWRCPEETYPLTFYGVDHGIDRRWRDGVVWSMDGYKKRLEIEEEFPPPL